MPDYHDSFEPVPPPAPTGKRPPYRPPVGIPSPIRERKGLGLAASVAIHALILFLIITPIVWAKSVIDKVPEGAGGQGPAGGGGGGTGGTGGRLRMTPERLTYLRIAPEPQKPQETPPPVLPPLPQVVPPQVQEQPKPEPAVPKPEEPAPPQVSSLPSATPGAGGGTGNDGTSGSGPGTGGGVGSGVGTGLGSGTGPGTGGGNAKKYPATLVNIAILPIPIPGSVKRPFEMRAYFDVDERGNAKLISFTPSNDAGYNRRIAEMLREVRYRPAVKFDGTPVRDTAVLVATAR